MKKVEGINKLTIWAPFPFSRYFSSRKQYTERAAIEKRKEKTPMVTKNSAEEE